MKRENVFCHVCLMEQQQDWRYCPYCGMNDDSEEPPTSGKSGLVAVRNVNDRKENIMEPRKVAIYKYEKSPGKSYYDKVADGHGIFHQFGTDYEEFESGPGNFTTAIIEMPDGSIRNVPVELVVFDD